MTALAGWLQPRIPTLKWIAAGSFTYPVAFGLAWVLWPDVAPRADALERLSFALQLAVAPAATMLVVLMSCMRILDTPEAEDPFAGAESRRWKVNARVLQNTLEQAAVFVPALIGLALRIDVEHQKALSILTALWCGGRFLFWIGYHVTPRARSIGFDWTFSCAFVAYAWFAWTLL